MAVRLPPTAKHVDQHLRPVLRINAARACLERHNGRATIVRPAQHRLRLKLLEGLAHTLKLGLQLRAQISLVLSQRHL